MIIAFSLMVVLAFVYLNFRVNQIMIYVGVPNMNSDEKIEVSFDGERIFFGSEVDNLFNYKNISVNKSFGFHEIEAVFTGGETFKEKVFIVYNQSVIIDFYTRCEEKESCMEVRSKFGKFRPD